MCALGFIIILFYLSTRCCSLRRLAGRVVAVKLIKWSYLNTFESLLVNAVHTRSCILLMLLLLFLPTTCRCRFIMHFSFHNGPVSRTRVPSLAHDSSSPQRLACRSPWWLEMDKNTHMHMQLNKLHLKRVRDVLPKCLCTPNICNMPVCMRSAHGTK